MERPYARQPNQTGGATCGAHDGRISVMAPPVELATAEPDRWRRLWTGRRSTRPGGATCRPRGALVVVVAQLELRPHQRAAAGHQRRPFERGLAHRERGGAPQRAAARVAPAVEPGERPVRALRVELARTCVLVLRRLVAWQRRHRPPLGADGGSGAGAGDAPPPVERRRDADGAAEQEAERRRHRHVVRVEPARGRLARPLRAVEHRGWQRT